MIQVKFYVTTAIDYANSKPHIGHAYEKIFADVIARFQKLQGKDVFFLTGTDEHGKKVENAAKEAGKSPKEFVDHIVIFFKELCEKLNISNDNFIRTTDENHIKTVLEIFDKVNKKGDIYKGYYEGLYCTSCEAFFTERDLINGECPIHKKKVDVVKEETYFFKLSKYQQQIIDHIKNNNFILPIERKNEILSRLKEDVRDLSISRSTFKWGIPFPIDKDHVLYVWMDALTNYISGLNDKKYWPADVHVIGKDIIWFHTVIWPAILLSAGMELPKQVFVHGFVNVRGEKLSKSGISIDPFQLIDEYGSDALRYFLLRNIPSGEDGDFSEEALIARINGELADDLGNLVNRVLVLTEKNFDGKVPKINKKELEMIYQKMLNVLVKAPEKVSDEIENYRFNVALDSIFHLISEANKYVNSSEPWNIKDKKRLSNVLYILLEVLRQSAILLYPFIPKTSEKMFDQLGLEKKFTWKDLKFGLIKGKINKGDILFKKINT